MNNNTSFIDFILKDRTNRTYLFIALVGVIVQFIIFKLLYPYADFFSDSYSYIYAAYANLDVSIWPIGYSKFLQLFHAITYSDNAVTGFQYFLLETSAFYFFITILYFFNLNKTNQIILFVFLFFNPLFLFFSNYINSDPLFTAISVLWFTQLLWIIQRPALSQIFIQAILIFLAFTIRNNAYYYPIISTLAFVLSKQSLAKKITGSILGILFIIPFVIHTRNAAYKLTGTKQFSLFTGWQLANNALYIYNKANVDSTKFQNEKLLELNNLSIEFFKRTGFGYDEMLNYYVGNFYIRERYSPLKRYMEKTYKITNDSSVVVAWGKSSAIFSDFGSTIIKNYPLEFLKYYIVINIRNYFIPPLEKLEIYNLGIDNVPPIVKYWFHYKTNNVKSVSKTAQGTILVLFPIIFMAINLYLICSILIFIFKKSYKSNPKHFNLSLLLTMIFLIINAAFCVFATIIVFRYEIFPMIICLWSALLISEKIYRQAASKDLNISFKDSNELSGINPSYKIQS